MSGNLSQIDLTQAEIAKLPAGIRRKIAAAFTPDNLANGEWMLVGAPTDQIAGILDQVLSKLMPFVSAHAAAQQEKNIDKLLEIIAEDLPRARVERDLELDNAELRAAYLAQIPVLSAAQVWQQSSLKPGNKSEPASRWKREGKLFAVRKGGADLYPAFQFEDGAPNPLIKKVLEALPQDMTSWQIALWFASGNGWLDGAMPQECLSNPAGLISAAERLADPAVG